MPGHKPTYGNFFEFKKDDVFHNRIKTYPKVEFFIYTGSVYYNNENQNYENPDITSGFLSLHDLNVNRTEHSSSGDDQIIKPFVTKQGSFYNIKSTSAETFNLDLEMGDEIYGTYPQTASISVDRYSNSLSTAKKRVLYALKSTLDYYRPLSEHYAYSSSFANKEEQRLNLISIPSIFYGSSIKKGSIVLKYYVTGTLVGEASDTLRNGQIIHTSGSSAMVGTTVGVALYNEGFVMLTSSQGIDTHKEPYEPSSMIQYSASWNYFGNTGSFSSGQSSYSLSFKGTNYIETVTMFAHAKENQLNASNNPTFLSASLNAFVGESIYHENSEVGIKNIASSSYKNHSASFKPVTYISKIGIYDENRNLIAIAGLANPVRKLEERGYTFKLKLDI